MFGLLKGRWNNLAWIIVVFYVLGLVDSAECNAEPPLTEYHTHKLNRHAQGRVHQHAKLAGGPNPASPYKDTWQDKATPDSTKGQVKKRGRNQNKHR